MTIDSFPERRLYMKKQKAAPNTKVIHSIIKDLKGPYSYKETSKKLDEAANKTHDILNDKTCCPDY